MAGTKDTWLVVANSTVARIFKVEKKESLIELQTMVHPESRLQKKEIAGEKPTRTFESVGPTRHAIEPTSDPKQLESVEFAKNIAQYLDRAFQQGNFSKLYLAASPTQLGLLRQHISPTVMRVVQGEVNKDMTHIKPEEIASHLPFLM